MSRETIQGISRNLQYFVYAVIIIALLFAVLGIPSSFTNLVINWLASLLVGSIAGAVTSLPAILLVEAFTGDRLKSILLLVEIHWMSIVVQKGLVSEGPYMSLLIVENAWEEKCRDKMCFLDNGAVAQKQVVELTRQNGKLEALIERLLERLS